MQALAKLQALSVDQADLEVMLTTNTNPKTGGDAQRICGFYSLMLRPARTLLLAARSPAMVLHRIEGGATVQMDVQQFTPAVADTCCALGYIAAVLTKLPASTPVLLFPVDESTLQRKLGLYKILD